jgi:hypothetical protein
MAKMRNLVLFSCCMAFSVLANIEISLSGTVKDEAGAAIAGAVVALSSNISMKDTTNTAGEFAIANSTAISQRGAYGISLFNANSIAIKGNQLRFYIASPAQHGVVSIFSINGKRNIFIPLGKMESGIHHYALPGLAAGFHTMHVTIDQTTTIWKLVNIGNEIVLSDNGAGVKGASWISPSAAAQSADTLVAKNDAFETSKTTIASYKQTGIAIVMHPVYAYSASVENTCADCAVPALPDATALTAKNSKLPDPFKKFDSGRLTKRSEWRCQRQLLLKQAMKYIYGEKPPPPAVVSGTVTSTKISVHVEDNGKQIDFTATVKLPTTGTAPYPAIISVGSFGGILMGESKILAEGVAIIMYDYGKIGTEGTDGSVDRTKDFKGLFYDIYGGKHSAGLLMAWAWGASRMIDVLQKSGGAVIDYRRLGVTGCSRTAKGAFAIGLFDERIALTLPEETSVGGIPAYRIADAKCSENTQNNFNGQLWLSNNFKPFVSNTSLLPIDSHELIATIAPRGLYSMENPSATQMCANGGNMAIQGGMDVYKALGAEKNLTYRSDTPSGTSHCSYTSNFTDPLIKNMTRFLKHESAVTGGIVAGSGTLTRSDWIDWTAPTLENDTKLYDTN